MSTHAKAAAKFLAGREMPHFARRSFNELWKEGKIATEKKEKR